MNAEKVIDYWCQEKIYKAHSHPKHLFNFFPLDDENCMQKLAGS